MIIKPNRILIRLILLSIAQLSSKYAGTLDVDMVNNYGEGGLAGRGRHFGSNLILGHCWIRSRA